MHASAAHGIVVTGEPGSGKSHLLRAFEQALAPSAMLSHIDVDPDAAPHTLSTCVQLLQALDLHDAPELHPTLQALAAIQMNDNTNRPSSAAQSPVHLRRLRLLHQLSQTLRTLITPRASAPTHIMIDDADQADELSQRFLRVLCGQLDGTNIFLVLSATRIRTDDPLKSLPIHRLAPFTRTALEAVAASAAVRTALGTRAALASIAGGSPGTLMRMLALLDERQRMGALPLNVPPSVTTTPDALAQTMLGRGFTDAEMQALQILSCAREVSLHALPNDEVRSAVHQLAEEAAVAVTAQCAAIPLQALRSAVHWSMGVDERRRIHAQLARATAATEPADSLFIDWHAAHSGAPSAEILQRLLAHATTSATEGDYPLAVEVAECACSLTADAQRLGDALLNLIDGLQRLEYRGYDSTGVTLHSPNAGATTCRTTGRVAALNALLDDAWSTADRGIGHTRWATHGEVNEANAHPHRDDTDRVGVVHNGIIDNADALRDELIINGHHFASDVDSEVIAHLVADALQASGTDLASAVSAATERLQGTWAIAALDTQTGAIVVTAHRSPLLIAVSDDGVFAASDSSAMREVAETFTVLEDREIVALDAVAIQPTAGARDGLHRSSFTVTQSVTPSSADAAEFEDHMNHEIREQPLVARRVLDAYAPALLDAHSPWSSLALPTFRRVAIIGCGTSLNAGETIAWTFSRLGATPTSLVVASESQGTVLEDDTLVIAMSQSGETADVLRAIDDLNLRHGHLVAITNTAHSSLARRADVVLDRLAGEEIGVAATKTFTAQVVTGITFAISALHARGTVPRSIVLRLLNELYELPDHIEQAISAAESAVPSVLDSLSEHSGMLLLGRGTGVPYAREGALKIKELTYRWAEAFPAGGLKHGPLALIEKGTPVIVVDHSDPRLPRNIAEVQARGANVLRIGGAGSNIPAVADATLNNLGRQLWGPLEAAVPLQVISRLLPRRLGTEVDRPRNLAKAVTVE